MIYLVRFLSLFMCLGCFCAVALAAGTSIPNPDKVVKELVTAIAGGDVDAAVESMRYYTSGSDTPSSQSTLRIENTRTALNVLVKNGKAEFVDEVLKQEFGSSIIVYVEYLKFPLGDNRINQFVFVRCTFMKSIDGWQLTDVSIASSGVFPPAGFSNIPPAR